MFNRITLLFMIKEAILFARHDGRPIATQQDVERIGLCFLMANDLVLGYSPQPTDSLLQNVAGLLPFGDLLPRETPMEDMVRNLLILTQIIDRPVIRENSLRIDLMALFEEKCGISYHRFIALVFGAATRYNLPVSDESLLGDYPYLPPTSSAGRTPPVPK